MREEAETDPMTLFVLRKAISIIYLICLHLQQSLIDPLNAHLCMHSPESPR